MKKILVIGCPGSGKSVFSRRLSTLTGIKVYHMDAMFYNSDKTEVDREVMEQRIAEVMAEDSWILDGNYARTIRNRLEKADTVYYLDLPIEVCLQSIQDRIGTVRDDLPWHEETLDPEFYEYVRQFPGNQKIKVDTALEEYPELKVIRFTSREEVNEYLNKLENDNRDI